RAESGERLGRVRETVMLGRRRTRRLQVTQPPTNPPGRPCRDVPSGSANALSPLPVAGGASARTNRAGAPPGRASGLRGNKEPAASGSGPAGLAVLHRVRGAARGPSAPPAGRQPVGGETVSRTVADSPLALGP